MAGIPPPKLFGSHVQGRGGEGEERRETLTQPEREKENNIFPPSPSFFFLENGLFLLLLLLLFPQTQMGKKGRRRRKIQFLALSRCKCYCSQAKRRKGKRERENAEYTTAQYKAGTFLFFFVLSLSLYTGEIIGSQPELGRTETQKATQNAPYKSSFTTSHPLNTLPLAAQKPSPDQFK